MKKRFDTRFFVAFMPGDQVCATDNMETEQGVWLTPQSALEKNLDARIPLSPPTIATLTQLLKFNTMDKLRKEIQTRSWQVPIAPRLVPSPDGPVILEPWDLGFKTIREIDTSNFSKKILTPGTSFSRIWCDKGIWKPVGL